MNESIGGSLLLNIVIIMVGALIAVFTASFAYSKAFKAKNMIIDTIQENNGIITKLSTDPNEVEVFSGIVENEINWQLSEIGYRNGGIQCTDKGRYSDSDHVELINNSKLNRQGYCIYKIYQTNSIGAESYYYEVQTYMYFDIPLFNFKLPVYGQTKSYQSNPRNISEEEDEDPVPGEHEGEDEDENDIINSVPGTNECGEDECDEDD